MVHTANHPNTTTPETFVARKPSLETTLQAALEHARRLTEMYGTDNIEVAIAWETVEELQVARARNKAAELTALDRYCAANPDAPECRIYED